MFYKSSIYLCFTTMFVVISVITARNVPMEEETAKAQLVDIIDDHCKMIHVDKKSINQLMKFFHMEELENITACDLACDAYGVNTTALAEILLKSDGDLHYAILQINQLFDTDLLHLQNDVITVNIDAFNYVSEVTLNYSVEHLGKKNKVAAYMLKNLIEVQNRTNYDFVQNHIAELRIPAEEVLLKYLPILDSYHKYVRNNEKREEIDYDDQHYNFDDEFDQFEKQQMKELEEKKLAEKEKQEKKNVTEEEMAEKKNDTEDEDYDVNDARVLLFDTDEVITTETAENETETTEEVTTEELITTEKNTDETEGTKTSETVTITVESIAPRLINQFIANDLPIAQLKEKLIEKEVERKDKEEQAYNEQNTLANKGIRNIARARMEDRAPATANDDYSDEYPNEDKDTDDTDVSDDNNQAHSRDFAVSYEDSSEKEPPKKGNGNNKDKKKGIMGSIMDTFKGGISNVLGFVRNSAVGVLDAGNDLVVNMMGEPTNWFERVVNYPKNFVMLQFIDGLRSSKRAIESFFNPMIESMSPNNAERGMNPFGGVMTMIKGSIMSWVRMITSSISHTPFAGRFMEPMLNATVTFIEGYLNRIFPG